MSSKSPMKKIDQYAFQEIDNLSTNETYQKVQESFSNLEDREQGLLQSCLTALIFIIPISIVIVFISSNSTLREEFKLKEKIIMTANNIINGKRDLSQIERSHLSNESISQENQIQNKISGLLNIAGIESSKVSTSGFEVTNEAGSINKVKTDIKLDNMTNNELFDVIRQFSSKAQIRIDEINIQRNKGSGKLSGILTVYYFSKQALEEE